MDTAQWFHPRHYLLSLSLPVLLLSGCAFSTINMGPKPLADFQPQLVPTIVVGDFKSDRLSEEQRRKLVEGIQGQLKEQAAFAQVLDKVPVEEKDDQMVILNGEVLEFKEGNKTLQWLVGFGAGAAKMAVAFNISTLDGRQIAAFSAKRTYAGGLGIGGPSFVSMDGLIERVAKDIAATASKWKRREPIGGEESGVEKK